MSASEQGCRKCARRVRSRGLCRRCGESEKGRKGGVKEYTPREGRVRRHGLRLLPGTVAKLEEAMAGTHLAFRALNAAILEAWARGRVWKSPPPALGGALVGLALVAGLVSTTCVHRAPGPATAVEVVELGQVEPVYEEAFVLVVEQEQVARIPRRVIPNTPLEWQKKPPCDVEMGEEAIRGACYLRLQMKPPCGRLIEHEGACLRAVAKSKEMPVSLEPR